LGPFVSYKTKDLMCKWPLIILSVEFGIGAISLCFEVWVASGLYITIIRDPYHDLDPPKAGKMTQGSLEAYTITFESSGARTIRIRAHQGLAK